jgi:hypothetical protein
MEHCGGHEQAALLERACFGRSLGIDVKTFSRKSIHTEISPLRFALSKINLRPPDFEWVAHDFSGRDDKG